MSSSIKNQAKTHKHTLSATYANYMIRFAKTRGITTEQLLLSTGLVASDLHEQNARIAAWQQATLLKNLLKLTNDPSISIEIGLASNLTKAGFISHGLMSCATLGDAIELGRRFIQIQIPFFELDFDLEGETAIITVKEAIPLLHFRSFTIENFLIEVSEIFRSLQIGKAESIKSQKTNLHLYFDYPEPNYFATYKDRLPHLHFNQPANQFRFPAKLLDLPIHTANPAMTELVISQGESTLEQLGYTKNWLDRVRILLVCRDGQYPTLPRIAQHLNMSERTLKRKLAELNISFLALLNAVRLKDAYYLLQNTTLKLDEVGLRVGYQDPANFTRAFRSWTGETPSQYRTEYRKSLKK